MTLLRKEFCSSLNDDDSSESDSCFGIDCIHVGLVGTRRTLIETEGSNLSCPLLIVLGPRVSFRLQHLSFVFFFDERKEFTATTSSSMIITKPIDVVFYARTPTFTAKTHLADLTVLSKLL